MVGKSGGWEGNSGYIMKSLLCDDGKFGIYTESSKKKKFRQGFPGGAVVENLPANAGDMGSSPGLGRSHMPRSN